MNPSQVRFAADQLNDYKSRQWALRARRDAVLEGDKASRAKDVRKRLDYLKSKEQELNKYYEAEKRLHSELRSSLLSNLTRKQREFLEELGAIDFDVNQLIPPYTIEQQEQER